MSGRKHTKAVRAIDAFRDDEAPFIEVEGPRTTSNDPSPLAAREKLIEGRRYIVCRNEDQARKDEADRWAIVESLEE